MRFYEITAGSKTYTARNNPTALNAEFDISVYSADRFDASTIRVWGIALQDIGQASDLIGQSFKIDAGMQQGLPLANVQAPEAGTLIQGFIWKCFGNWVMTDMTLDFVVLPGQAPNQLPRPNEPWPLPKNIILNWKKGTQLSQALQQALQTAYQGQQIFINVSSQLVAPQDNIGYYANLRELNEYVRRVSQQILTGQKNYPGVGIVMQNGSITAWDGTQATNNHQILFTDLIGQPIWIDIKTIQIKVVMRGNLKVGDNLTLPPTPTIVTGAAQSGIPGQKLTFQGTFNIVSLRHVGNFRQPDGSAWSTIIEALQTEGNT